MPPINNLSARSTYRPLTSGEQVVNDKHSQLNPTTIKASVIPHTAAELSKVVRLAAQNNDRICIAGGRHAMGGQQFLKNGLLIDTQCLNQVINFDREKGQITVQAGMTWPTLISWLQKEQVGTAQPWTIAQKQTGCDTLSIGGALGANVHGRGLALPPLVHDVESFTLITHDGAQLKCSRSQNQDLFKLVIGGYGLFGIIESATLKLIPRTVLRRDVELIGAREAVARLEEQAKNGATFSSPSTTSATTS